MSKFLWAAFVALGIVSPAEASPDFDRPAAIQRIEPKSDNDPSGAWICTRYTDLMLREDSSDTPAPDKATLWPLKPNARPACSKQNLPDQITLDTEGMAFAGRKGLFLIFTMVDTNGSMPFRVLDAHSGKILFADSMAITGGIASVALEGAALKLSYRRAIDANCGLPKEGAGCWASIIREADIPPEIATRAPPLQACAASYRRDKAPPDDPSIVSYDVALILDSSGTSKSIASGIIGCEPRP
jgi:hypothetical protein